MLNNVVLTTQGFHTLAHHVHARAFLLSFPFPAQPHLSHPHPLSETSISPVNYQFV